MEVKEDVKKLLVLLKTKIALVIDVLLISYYLINIIKRLLGQPLKWHQCESELEILTGYRLWVPCTLCKADRPEVLVHVRG